MNNNNFLNRMHNLRIALLVLLTCIAGVSIFNLYQNSHFNTLAIFVNVFWLIWLVFSYLIVASILKNFETEASPFTLKNSKLLQILSIAIMLIEPLHLLFSNLMRFSNNAYSTTSLQINYFSSFGGMIFIVGFILYIVAAVFKYGVSLQQLSDETL